ncbi:MAG: hypothetical protein P8R54_31265 [Myxococcota bacterium]|nr:hypothetical protein [Myxococcota bacterium]
MRRFSVLFLITGCAVQGETDIQIQAAQGSIADTEAPVITILSPNRGEWGGEGDIMVTGELTDAGGIAAATINGIEIPMQNGEQNQAFVAPVSLAPGINTVVLTATDASGNISESRLSVMGGQAMPIETKIRKASVVEINNPMFDMVTAPLSNNMGNRELIMDSVGQDTWSDCAVFEGTVDSILLGDAIVAVTPGEDGLNVAVSFSSVSAGYSGTADICGIEEDFSVTISNPTPFYSAIVSLSVEDGALVASVDESYMDMTDAVMTSNVDGDLADHGMTLADIGIDEMIGTMIAGSMDTMMPQALPTAIDSLIPDGIGIEGFGASEISYTMEGVRTDADGMGIAYSAEVSQDEDAVNMAPGAIYIPVRGGGRHTDEAIVMSSTVNLMNRAIHTAWESGDVTAVVNAEDKGITVSTWTTMPPVIQPGEETTINIGEMHVALNDEDSLVTRYSVQASADISFDVDESGNPIMVATLNDWHGTLLDGVENTALDSEIAEVVQATFDAALPNFAGQQSAAADMESTTEVTGNNNDWVSTSYTVNNGE